VKKIEKAIEPQQITRIKKRLRDNEQYKRKIRIEEKLLNQIKLDAAAIDVQKESSVLDVDNNDGQNDGQNENANLDTNTTDVQEASEVMDTDVDAGQKENGEPEKDNIIDTVQIVPHIVHSMAAVNIKCIQPEPFCGSPSEDAADWIDRLKAYFETVRTDSSLKCKVFQLLLREVASVWFKSLPDTVRNTHNFNNDLATPFVTKFVTNNTKWMARQTLEMRVMTPGETTAEYIRDILIWAARLDIRGEEHTHILIRGLRPALKAGLMALQPKGLEDTIEKIRLAETIEDMKKMNDSPHTSWSSSQSRTSPQTSWKSSSQSRISPQTSWSSSQSRISPQTSWRSSPRSLQQTSSLPTKTISALN
jgi:hypothetical protein